MKKRGIWVKVKPAVGLYHLRFDVSRFTDESRAGTGVKSALDSCQTACRRIAFH